MSKRLRVYVAGAYSSDNVLGVLDNIRKGIRTATEAFLTGECAPFVPWFDYQFQLSLREGESLTVPDYYEYSLAWLEVSDCVLVLPGWEKSKGTIAEIERAKELRIPVFYSMNELTDFISSPENRKTRMDSAEALSRDLSSILQDFVGKCFTSDQEDHIKDIVYNYLKIQFPFRAT